MDSLWFCELKTRLSMSEYIKYFSLKIIFEIFKILKIIIPKQILKITLNKCDFEWQSRVYII